MAGWAKRFLFRSEQLETPVGRLSGGEQARVLIARLVLEPADVLLLDEPTNDLDIPTLEVLEESLLEFPGALVLVTHDRYLLDRVSTRLLALDGQGGALFFADYAQWERGRRGGGRGGGSRERVRSSEVGPGASARSPARSHVVWATSSNASGSRWRRASWKRSVISPPARRPRPIPPWPPTTRRWRSASAALAAAQARVEELYGRWAELEAKVKA